MFTRCSLQRAAVIAAVFTVVSAPSVAWAAVKPAPKSYTSQTGSVRWAVVPSTYADVIVEGKGGCVVNMKANAALPRGVGCSTNNSFFFLPF